MLKYGMDDIKHKKFHKYAPFIFSFIGSKQTEEINQQMRGSDGDKYIDAIIEIGRRIENIKRYSDESEMSEDDNAVMRYIVEDHEVYITGFIHDHNVDNSAGWIIDKEGPKKVYIDAQSYIDGGAFFDLFFKETPIKQIIKQH